MSEYAQIIDGFVAQVIVSDQEHINTLEGKWIETSNNIRGNYAGIGYIYDNQNDVFYAPQPYQSWVLNKTTYLWESPTPMPLDGKLYLWDETSLSWVTITI